MVLSNARTDAIRVFISYSRRDLNIAGRLVTALEDLGFQVTIDRRDLPYGEEWLKELSDFIAGGYCRGLGQSELRPIQALQLGA